MKLTKITLIILILTAVMVLPSLSLAQLNIDLINEAAEGADYPGGGTSAEIPQTVGRLVSIVLSLVGALFFIFIVTAGIEWMTAGGNEEKVAKAQRTITQSVIGLAITLVAYFITWFISNALGAIGTTPVG